VKWTRDNGSDYSTDNPLTVSGVTEDLTLTARFVNDTTAAGSDWSLYQ
jgi:uncharacterized repeat protein (TIGR02543 family)